MSDYKTENVNTVAPSSVRQRTIRDSILDMFTSRSNNIPQRITQSNAKHIKSKSFVEERKLNNNSIPNTNNLNSSKTRKINKITYKINGEKFKIFDYYKPVRILGNGAYGVVIESLDLRNKAKLAIKKNKGVFNSLSDAKRILREIKLMSHFDHPNIIPLVAVIPPEPTETDTYDEVYLVMPKMETSLRRIVRGSQELNEKHKKYFVYQMLRAFQYLHSADVIHRDLKPENILVDTENCKLRITDFGLARGVANDSDDMTQYVVTRWYRAPEVICNPGHYDTAVDVWAIGCIMSEFWLRQPFFRGSNYMEQLKVIFYYRGKPKDLEITATNALQCFGDLDECPPQDLRRYINISDTANDLLSKMLEVNPKKRITVLEAMKHPWLAKLYRESDIRLCEKFDTSFEFEKSINTLFGVRHMLYEELTNFRKKRHEKLLLKQQLQKAKTMRESTSNSKNSISQTTNERAPKSSKN